MKNRIKEIKDFREATEDELISKIDEMKKELFNLRFQSATMALDNPSKISEVRKSIARAKTILTEKERISEN